MVVGSRVAFETMRDDGHLAVIASVVPEEEEEEEEEEERGGGGEEREEKGKAVRKMPCELEPHSPHQQEHVSRFVSRRAATTSS